MTNGVLLSAQPDVTKAQVQAGMQLPAIIADAWGDLAFGTLYQAISEGWLVRTGTADPAASDKKEGVVGLWVRTDTGKLWYHSGVAADAWVELAPAPAPTTERYMNIEVLGSYTIDRKPLSTALTPPYGPRTWDLTGDELTLADWHGFFIRLETYSDDWEIKLRERCSNVIVASQVRTVTGDVDSFQPPADGVNGKTLVLNIPRYEAPTFLNLGFNSGYLDEYIAMNPKGSASTKLSGFRLFQHGQGSNSTAWTNVQKMFIHGIRKA